MIDENVAEKIVRHFDPKPGDRIVEIGPGFGVLTRHLLAAGSEVWAVEIDERLIPVLHEKFAEFRRFHLMHADFRRLSLDELDAAGEPFRLIGNIPYHITSSIIFRGLEQAERIRDIMLMVQREVAERLAAPPGGKEYGLLSVLCAAFAEVEICFHVSRHVFRPRPEVESSVVHIRLHPEKLQRIRDRKFFAEGVKRLFGQRRKTLRNSLKRIVRDLSVLDGLGLDLERRVETCSAAELIALMNRIYDHEHANRLDC